MNVSDVPGEVGATLPDGFERRARLLLALSPEDEDGPEDPATD